MSFTKGLYKEMCFIYKKISKMSMQGEDTTTNITNEQV
jgi:hypothetical protein